MIKTALISALFCLASSQGVKNLVDQVNAASNDILSQSGAISQSGDAVSLTINNYEWTLTEYGNEYELNVEALATNANNLAPTLAALLSNVGEVSHGNSDLIGGIIDSEAQNVGVEVVNGDLIASAVSNQYGHQLQNNAESISAAATQGYSQAAQALNTNQNGALDQTNQQLNEALQNPESTSQLTNGLLNQAIGQAPNNLPSSPVEVTGNTAPLNNAIINAANNLNADKATAAVNNVADQAASAVQSLQGDTPSVASNAANAATDSAVASAGSAATNLNADIVLNNAGAVASNNLGKN